MAASQSWFDPGNGVPKYRQLQQVLEELIDRLQPGDPLPPERQLELEYGVSRVTVRQALQQLVLAGRLERIQGRGTFVARPKLEQVLALTSFTEDMIQRGLRPGSRTLGVEQLAASPSVAQHLRLPEGSPVLMLRRLRLADDEPMALETVYLPASRFPDLTQTDLTNRSLYAWLAERHGVELTHATQTIEATVLGAEEARLLEVAPGIPAFRLERVSYDQFGRPVELVRSLYRGDRYKLHARLERPRGTTPSSASLRRREAGGDDR
ncbi:HTH-type transcriptional repressor DasR [bacterium HR26]|nr:HTH-type transcriptional repressor DasR [bacterium HR26]